MKKYFDSIGFKKMNTKLFLSGLQKQVIVNPTEKYYSSSVSEKVYAEYYKEYSDGTGLTVRGIADDNDNINVQSFLPYAESSIFMDVEAVSIEKSSDGKYIVFCEEVLSGNEIIFILHNICEYYKLREFTSENDDVIKRVSVAALASDGKVILPVYKSDEDDEIDFDDDIMNRKETLYHTNMNYSSLSELENEIFQASDEIRERLKDEDLLSVVEGYMLPFDDSDSEYSVLGEIIEMENIINSVTDETIIRLRLNLLGTDVDLFINSEDLTGIPSVGMRFIGNCCMQGFIC